MIVEAARFDAASASTRRSALRSWSAAPSARLSSAASFCDCSASSAVLTLSAERAAARSSVICSSAAIFADCATIVASFASSALRAAARSRVKRSTSTWAGLRSCAVDAEKQCTPHTSTSLLSSTRIVAFIANSVPAARSAERANTTPPGSRCFASVPVVDVYSFTFSVDCSASLAVSSTRRVAGSAAPPSCSDTCSTAPLAERTSTLSSSKKVALPSALSAERASTKCVTRAISSALLITIKKTESV